FHRQVMDALGIRLLAGPSGRDPAMCDEVADEAARRLELLPGLREHRIDEVLAEQVPLGPQVFLAGESETFQAPPESRAVTAAVVAGGPGCWVVQALILRCA